MAIERNTNLSNHSAGLPFARALMGVVGTAVVLHPLGIEAFAADSHHAPSFTQILHYWFNFLVYIALLYFALRSVISSSWAVRRNQIKNAVRRSTSDLKEAEDQLKIAETLSRSIASAEGAARDEILRQAEVEAASLIEAAREKAQRIAAQTNDIIAAENRSAEMAVREELIGRAVEIAKQRLVAGDSTDRQGAYLDAAVSRARRLVQ